MDIQLLRPDSLTHDHWNTWSDIQRANPALESPYFRPEFTQAVAAVRDDVEVAVLSQSGELVGFFPFHRGRFNIGKSVGLWMSDYQGVIVGEEVDWNADQLVRGCGLAAWDFRNLVASQIPMQKHHVFLGNSVYIDLSKGYEEYERGLLQRAKKRVKEIQRHRRKLESDLGPVRLEFGDSTQGAFEQLLDWKTRQFRRTKVPNVLASPWTVELLKQTIARQTEAFSGVMMALYAGDHLLAADLSLRSYDVVHGWIIGFNPTYRKYSPGMVMHLDYARVAPSRGVRIKDMGDGSPQYKNMLTTGEVPIAEGSVACQPLAKVIRSTRRGLRELVRSSPLRGAAQSAARKYYWLRGRIGQSLQAQEGNS